MAKSREWLGTVVAQGFTKEAMEEQANDNTCNFPAWEETGALPLPTPTKPPRKSCLQSGPSGTGVNTPLLRGKNTVGPPPRFFFFFFSFFEESKLGKLPLPQELKPKPAFA